MQIRPTRLPTSVRMSLLVVGVLVLGGAGGVGIAWHVNRQKTELPAAVTQKVAFKPSVTKLPDGFTIDAASAETEDGVLAYVAKNAAGESLVVSEQPKPTAKKIASFETENIQQSQSVSGARYPSMIGDAPVGGKIVSITTDTTWLIISSTSAQAEANLRFIAINL